MDVISLIGFKLFYKYFKIGFKILHKENHESTISYENLILYKSLCGSAWKICLFLRVDSLACTTSDFHKEAVGCKFKLAITIYHQWGVASLTYQQDPAKI